MDKRSLNLRFTEAVIQGTLLMLCLLPLLAYVLVGDSSSGKDAPPPADDDE